MRQKDLDAFIAGGSRREQNAGEVDQDALRKDLASALEHAQTGLAGEDGARLAESLRSLIEAADRLAGALERSR